MAKADRTSNRIARGHPIGGRVGEGIDVTPDHASGSDYAASLYDPEGVIDGGSEGFVGD